MYRPDKFSATFHREGGAEIWSFLNEANSILRMEAASYLWRPAIETLSPSLLQKFGPTIKRTHIKQMIGHMTRQILERRGYRLQQANMKITRAGNMFSRGSRYTRDDLEYATASGMGIDP